MDDRSTNWCRTRHVKFVCLSALSMVNRNKKLCFSTILIFVVAMVMLPAVQNHLPRDSMLIPLFSLLDTIRGTETRETHDYSASFASNHGNQDDSRTSAPPLSRGCLKHLHILGNVSHMARTPALRHYNRLFANSTESPEAGYVNCIDEGYDCNLRLTRGENLTSMRGKDAVMFGMVHMQFRDKFGRAQLHELINMRPERGQTWVYYATESPLRMMRWTRDEELGRLKYHIMMTYDSESDIVLPFGYYRRYGNSKNDTEKRESIDLEKFISNNRTGLMAWMSSNCAAFWPRMGFVQKMLKLLPGLDDYGECGHKKCLPKRSEKCNQLLSTYKFYLAIPNSECNDYITEKFWMMSLRYGSVPVVLGSKKEQYEKVAPPNSYIHMADFESYEDLANYIKLVDKDDALYKKYHEWRTEGEALTTFPTRPKYLCQILPLLNTKKWKYLKDSPWYTGCRLPPDRNTFHPPKAEKRRRKDLANWTVWR